MPERDVPSPGLDWLAFHKRNKPPPLTYWSEVRPPRPSKYKSVPINTDRERGSLWDGKVLSPHPSSPRAVKSLRSLIDYSHEHTKVSNVKVIQPSRTAKRGSSGSIRRKQRAIRALDKVCRYCMTAPAETADHILPKSRGGKNSRLNLVGCCLPCNAQKADRTPKEAGMKLHLPLRFFTYIKEVTVG